MSYLAAGDDTSIDYLAQADALAAAQISRGAKYVFVGIKSPSANEEPMVSTFTNPSDVRKLYDSITSSSGYVFVAFYDTNASVLSNGRIDYRDYRYFEKKIISFETIKTAAPFFLGAAALVAAAVYFGGGKSKKSARRGKRRRSRWSRRTVTVWR